MAQFLNDTFTDTDAKKLTGAGAHVGETGATWANAGDADALVEISSNRLRNDGSGAGLSLLYASGVPLSADYDVEATYYVAATDSDGSLSIAGRVATDATTCYFLRWVTTGQWQLYKMVAASYTQLDTWDETLSVADTRAVKLEMRGSTIKGYIAGTERLSATDGDITAAGRAGVRCYGAATGGMHLADITATDAPSTSVPVFAHHYRQQGIQ